MMYRNVISLCIDAVRAMNHEEFRAVRARLGDLYGVQLHNPEQLRKWMVSLTYLERDKVHAICRLLALDIDEFLRRERPYMTGEQILDLHRDGFTIGGHSCNHPELWLLDWEDAVREIVDSCDAVRELTNQERVPFAFPFSGAALSREKLAQLRREHQFLSLFYDTNGLWLEREFIANRIVGDKPAGCEGGRSNFPLLMREAYALEPLRRMKRLVQGMSLLVISIIGPADIRAIAAVY